MKVNERTGALINLCQDLTEKYAAQVAVLGMMGFMPAGHFSAGRCLPAGDFSVGQVPADVD